jgi:hypothetical protein
MRTRVVSRVAAAIVAVGWFAAGSACTRLSDDARYEVQSEPLEIVATAPVAGATDVATTAAIDLCFSHVVDPRSLAPTDATISSGETPLDGEASFQLVPWQGPQGARIDFDEDPPDGPWCSGSVLSVRPRAPLLAGLHYRLRLVPRARGWNGELLDTEAPGWVPEGNRFRYYLEFTVDPTIPPGRDDEASTTGDATTGDVTTGDVTTGDATTGDVTTGDVTTGDATTGDDDDDPFAAPTLTDLFAPGRVFSTDRDTCSCHRGSDELATGRLDLSDPARAFASLVNDPRERDNGFAMISPRRPSESFLIQKLVRDHDGQPLRGIIGDPMPPDEPIAYADYVDLALWIAGGANP